MITSENGHKVRFASKVSPIIQLIKSKWSPVLKTDTAYTLFKRYSTLEEH